MLDKIREHHGEIMSFHMNSKPYVVIIPGSEVHYEELSTIFGKSADWDIDIDDKPHMFRDGKWAIFTTSLLDDQRKWRSFVLFFFQNQNDAIECKLLVG